MAKKPKKNCLIILLALIVTDLANADCYQLIDPTGNVLYNDTIPPFDLSYPPYSPEYQSARDAGQQLIIDHNKDCNKTAEKEPEIILPTEAPVNHSPYTRYPSRHPSQSYIPNSIPHTPRIHHGGTGGGKGCGSRGGPGYRKSNGQCAGWDE